MSSSPPDRTESPTFRRLGALVVRLRWPLLIANLALTAYFASQAPRLMMDTGMKALMISQSEAARVQERLEDTFGVDVPFMVVVEGDVFSLPYLEKLKRFHEDLEQLDMELASLGKRDLRDDSGKVLVRARDREDDDQAKRRSALTGEDFADFGDAGDGWGDEAGGTMVDEIVSLINVRDTRYVDGGLRVEGLFEDWPPDPSTLEAKKALALSRKSIVGQVVGEDARHSVIFLRTDFMDSEDMARVDTEIRRIGARHEAEGFHVLYSGVPAFSSELERMLMANVGTMNGLGFLLIFLLLAWLFRHPVGILGPILVVGQAIVWTVGSMAVMRTPMTVISTILPSFIICVGIGDAVHMLSVYRQNKASGLENRAAIVAAVSHTGRPVLFTTLTTCTGLLSFRFASLDAIRDFGLFGALGVFYALLASLLLLPALLTFAPRGRFGLRTGAAAKPPWSARVLAACNRLSAPDDATGQHNAPRNRVLGAGALLLALCAGGMALARVHHNPLLWLPEYAQAREAVEILDNHVGGSSDVSLLLQAKPGKDLRDKDAMARVAELERYVLAYPPLADGSHLVESSTGLIDVLRETSWALRGQRPEQYRLPETQRGLVDVFTMFESASPDRLRRLMTLDAELGLMLVRMRWVEGAIYAAFGKYLERGIDRIIGDALDVFATGTVYQAIQSDNAVVGDLLRSFGLALVVITLLMVMVLGDRRLGLIAMVPNLLPIGLVLAFMGVTGIGIDMSNLLIASIGIGIAVDDTIHYLHHFRAHHAAHGDREAAIDHAFQRAGAAMINTSVILLGGFLVFMAAELNNLRVFGLLIGVTVLFALAIDLIFTPALLRLAYPPQRA